MHIFIYRHSINAYTHIHTDIKTCMYVYIYIYIYVTSFCGRKLRLPASGLRPSGAWASCPLRLKLVLCGCADNRLPGKPVACDNG